MVNKLVRLAMACEYSRLPIRRGDISTKVLGEMGGRKFKLVFEGAQEQLRQVFGMEMVELPGREKVTVAQRRGKRTIPHMHLYQPELPPQPSAFTKDKIH